MTVKDAERHGSRQAELDAESKISLARESEGMYR